MALTHISLDPDAAWREQRIEVERRIGVARDALDAAMDGLAALDDLETLGRRKPDRSWSAKRCRWPTPQERWTSA
ncbi:MAG: hypothetical protein M3Y91_09415 [Actinomycetota bacterium]|nr:hypothetical protein [Actinomycetota bacterium]